MYGKRRNELTLYLYSANGSGTIASSSGKIAKPAGTVTGTLEKIHLYIWGFLKFKMSSELGLFCLIYPISMPICLICLILPKLKIH